MFFGFEIVLEEFSLDALAATILSAVTADVISRAFFGGAPFFAAVPHDLSVTNDSTYLLIAVLGIAAGLIGVAFQKTLLQRRGRRGPSVGERPSGCAPSLAGCCWGWCCWRCRRCTASGIPVMDKVLAGHDVLWFVLILMVGKILAASLILWIGGSGGGVAPSLFTGAAAGTALGSSSIICSVRRSGRRRCTAWSRWGAYSPPPRRRR